MNPLNPLAPYWQTIRLVLCGLLLAFVFLSGRSCGKQAGDAEVSTLKRQHAEQTAKVAKLAVKAVERVRASEHAWGDAFIAVSRKHYEDLSDAKTRADNVAAGLLSGALQLRDHWRGGVSVPGQAAAPAGAADAAAARRAADSSALVQIGAEFDAYARACQATLTAERASSP
jgi:hypothetical protein